MAIKAELKPCPKCGGNHLFYDLNRDGYVYCCISCEIWPRKDAQRYPTLEEAIAAWNRRKGEEAPNGKKS